ncbi:MAG: metallophosphoesterase [Candidatus Thorarchaeota archaeon]|nr:metallophosphoesterase [Candidatus Thorarchaeota archaeon]
MRIAAVSDIHSPRYFSEFKEALLVCERPDLFLLAGDMVDAGNVNEYRNISNAITELFGDELPIVACFGNDENGASIRDMKDIVRERIVFLDGDTTVIHYNGRKIGILGVPMLNVARAPKDSTLEDIFEKKIDNLTRNLGDLSKTCDQSIFLLHYSPLSAETYPEDFSWWVSRTFSEAKPELVIHGHIHWATKSETRIRNTRVFNVAYPSTRKITELLF